MPNPNEGLSTLPQDSGGLPLAGIWDETTGAFYVERADNAVDKNTKVSASPRKGALTDRSGTITTGGTSQSLMAANARRNYLFIENLSLVDDLWINFTTSPAVQVQPSLRIPATASFVMEAGFISTEAIAIIGPTTGQAFCAKEG